MAANWPHCRYRRIGLPRGPLVAWKGRGGRVISRVRTMGLGGLFIVTPEPLVVGDVIHLYFEIPGGEVRASAAVRSSIPGEGMGIEFTSMNPETRAKLQRLLERLVGDAHADSENL